MPHALRQGARKRRRRGSALRITRATKLPLRRQVRGRLGWCSKSHYPRIIVFNSFSRRIISQGLVRPPICSFFFPSSQNRRTALIFRSLVSSPGPEKFFQCTRKRPPITKTSATVGSVDTILLGDRCLTYALIACRSSPTKKKNGFTIIIFSVVF